MVNFALELGMAFMLFIVLLAYLVNRGGAACTAGELIAALWGDDGNLENRRAYLRTLTSDLLATLSRIGMKEVLIRKHRQWAVRRDLLDCDYYRMLAGDSAAINAFWGEYMSQYPWAKLTTAKLYFHADR